LRVENNYSKVKGLFTSYTLHIRRATRI